MGSPKALLDYRGETFLNRLIRVLGGVSDPVIAVLGYNADEIRKHVRGRVQLVCNPDPDRGQLSSLQAGLANVPKEAEGFLFTPVDSPAVADTTVAKLAAQFRNRKPETAFVIPRYQGKRGHPVFAARSVLREFLDLPMTAQAKDVVHRLVPQTEYVDVDDPGIMADIDDRRAYQQMIEQSQ